MKSLNITCVVGARPNFIKMAAIIHEIRRRPHLKAQLVHTGQHFSPEMSQSFFDELGLPEPDRNLEVSGGTQTEQMAEIMRRVEKVLLEEPRPDLLLVVGDVTSTVASALVAAKLGIKIAHVEAGLRSFDRRMPEELNRLVTDVLSDYLFATEPSGVNNLLAEGVPQSKIFFTGNVMIDTLLRFRDKAAQSDILTRLGLEKRKYAVVTLHRPSNVDEPEQLSRLLTMLSKLSEAVKVVFPVHPRTLQRIESFGLPLHGLILTPPQSYLDFLRLTSEARLILTDSGGIQEETTILQVPCLTLRENTERPATIEFGTNQLVGADPAKILPAALSVLQTAFQKGKIPELWDGQAATR
ncbi:MAG: UDP-N-acetylglucosamine 2-epimerase (non-hydrolyzing), partial [Bryobacteraceae bacterium]|nr:UDP-N-acetylglucosamine 2-epimerase (non-hydrolyzing) [Bryobacteraceae bacterium]